jgi:16S rRNA (adenine1518-N6/adenine1519-N6)-dimethyltransferase
MKGIAPLIEFLKRVDARPKKGLSQNFLIDPKIVEGIAAMAEVSSQDSILEIGPGPGALTFILLERGAKVFAVELDPTFAKELERFQNGKLKVFEADILKFPIERLPLPLKIVANLPYHITTPILEKIFAIPFTSLTIMVQKEVADRMCAGPGSKTFGSLSLFVRFYAKIGGTLSVPGASFYPQPSVDSTVIRLDSCPPPDVESKPFFTLVHRAFQKRRKMLTSSLEIDKEEVKKALISIGARPDARPEALSFEEWVLLTKHLQKFLL